MWLIVFFDLPTLTREERKKASNFRRFLQKDGYMMLQLSVYARVCNGQDGLEKHAGRLKVNLPPKGSIRAMQVTDQQYARMTHLLGNPAPSEKTEAKQLVLL